MSIIGVGMNILLAALLGAALVMGWRLNRRLKALRDSHEGFAQAVRELNVAAQRAEQGLADLRAATDEATDLLSDRIEKGRGLAARLERLIQRRAEIEDEAPAAERSLGALLAAARVARGRHDDEDEALELREPILREPVRREPPPAPRREPVQLRPRPNPEDELFADLPTRATLNAISGGRR